MVPCRRVSLGGASREQVQAWLGYDAVMGMLNVKENLSSSKPAKHKGPRKTMIYLGTLTYLGKRITTNATLNVKLNTCQRLKMKRQILRRLNQAFIFFFFQFIQA